MPYILMRILRIYISLRVANEEAMSFEEGTFSPEVMAGSSEARVRVEVLSALLRGCAYRRWSFGVSYRSKVRWRQAGLPIADG